MMSLFMSVYVFLLSSVAGFFPPADSTPMPSLPPQPNNGFVQVLDPSMTITGTISNGWNGNTQQVRLTVPDNTFNVVVNSTLMNYIKEELDTLNVYWAGAWQQRINNDYWMTIGVIALCLIAVFTIQKRETRL